MRPELLDAMTTTALQSLLDRYVELAHSTDCGCWDPELEPVVVFARFVLSQREAQR